MSRTTQQKLWKRYFTRAFMVGDYQVQTVGHIIPLSNGIVKEILGVINDGKSEIWFVADEFEEYLRRLGHDFLQPTWTLKEHVKDFEQRRKDLETTIRAAATAAPSAQLAELAQWYDKMIQVYSSFAVFVWYPWAITFFLEEWFREQLQHRYPDKWETMIECVGRTEKRIQMDNMIDAVCEWHLAKGSEQSLQAIADQYGYLNGYSTGHEPWTSQEIIKRAEPLASCEQRLQELPIRTATTKEEYQTLHNRLMHDDPQLSRVADAIHEYIWLRTERIDVYKWSLHASKPFYRRVEELMGWRRGSAVHVTKNEMLNALQGKATISNDEIERRLKTEYVVRMTIDDAQVYCSPEEKQHIIAQTIGENSYTQQEVSGQIARRGQVEGTARVLLHTGDVYQFQQGEILISNMTHPDYMPAIRKAAGIITDEGGIVCHAAVISRELGIPCVIGTGDATKIFKTGDRVMVDANSGIAKKIT